MEDPLVFFQPETFRRLQGDSYSSKASPYPCLQRFKRERIPCTQKSPENFLILGDEEDTNISGCAD